MISNFRTIPPMFDVLAIWFLFSSPAIASGADLGRVRILTPGQIQASLGQYAIVDARPKDQFEAGHLPGSVSTEWEDWVQQRPGLWNLWFGNPAKWGQVPSPSPRLQKRLRALGLSNGRPILVVGSPQGWGEEGRVAWNFLYWGAEQVVLLDGGYEAWQKNFPKRVERGDASRPRPGGFTIRLRPARRIDRQALAATLSQRTLLDVRTPEEFAGEKIRGQKRGGHLPNASLVPQRSLYAPDGSYLAAPALKKLLPSLTPSPVAYCVGGVRSALLALLVEERLGQVVQNYPGSLWDWAAHPSLPLE